MAYEYAVSAGPGTLICYGAVETIDDAIDAYYDGVNNNWRERNEDCREMVAVMIAYTIDAHDCETGR